MTNKKKIIVVVIAIAALIGGAVAINLTILNPKSKARAEANPNHYYSKYLSDKDVELLQNPQSLTSIEEIVGKVSELERITFGRDVYACRSEKYGDLLIEYGPCGVYKVKMQKNNRLVILFGISDDYEANRS